MDQNKTDLPPVQGKLYYLASPYSSPDPVVKEMRYTVICAIGAVLHNMGYALIEPIASSHPVAQKFQLPTGYEFWQNRDRLMIDHSDGVIVAMMQGWEQSVGVTDEIAYAESIGKPVYFIDPRDLLRTYPLEV